MATVQFNHNHLSQLPTTSLTSEIHSGPLRTQLTRIKWPTLGQNWKSSQGSLNGHIAAPAQVDKRGDRLMDKKEAIMNALHYHWLYRDQLEGEKDLKWLHQEALVIFPS
ncbi:hypothetical protein N7530_003386 [Penicillium desertorum]|uniref:Uncharacterized protein n=1 Tax=Penicillium desertorum TaxID=1303715 RepID=A0A9X0BPR6_9EURO|nr:hypothetical protein N7530_003386 [Penicillium desertorum]